MFCWHLLAALKDYGITRRFAEGQRWQNSDIDDVFHMTRNHQGVTPTHPHNPPRNVGKRIQSNYWNLIPSTHLLCGLNSYRNWEPVDKTKSCSSNTYLRSGGGHKQRSMALYNLTLFSTTSGSAHPNASVSNSSTVPDSGKDPFYAYEQAKLGRFELFLSSVSYPLFVTCSIFGIIGSTLILFTLCRNKRFSESSFVLYQAAGLFELNICLGFGFDFIFELFPAMRRFYVWLWMEELALRVFLDPFRESVTALIIFLSITRIVACFFPTRFEIIDRPFVYYSVIGVSVACFVMLDLPHIICTRITWDPELQEYSADTSCRTVVDGSHDVKLILWLALSVSVFISTALAIAALVKNIFMK